MRPVETLSPLSPTRERARVRGPKGRPDRREHRVSFLEPIRIPEPKDAETYGLQKRIALRIVVALMVLASIELDHEAPVEAAEVDDVGTDRLLTAELEAGELAVAQ